MTKATKTKMHAIMAVPFTRSNDSRPSLVVANLWGDIAPGTPVYTTRGWMLAQSDVFTIEAKTEAEMRKLINDTFEQNIDSIAFVERTYKHEYEPEIGWEVEDDAGKDENASPEARS